MSKKSAQNYLITGLSGSGKSVALKALEDLGFYCIDNLPMALLEKTLEQEHRKTTTKQLALGMDVRDPSFIESYEELIHTIKKHKFKIIFLDCDNKIIIQRFSESRRPHPYDAKLPLLKAILEEREVLEKLMLRAQHIINTSKLSVHDLKAKIKSLVGKKIDLIPLNITLTSFGYKNGIPSEADLVFDVRFLKNPYFNKKLKDKTGLDKSVQTFVMEQKEAQDFFTKLSRFLNYLLKQYSKEGKTYLNIAIGCTGGHHRSVTLIETLAKNLKKTKYQISILHRDLGK